MLSTKMIAHTHGARVGFILFSLSQIMGVGTIQGWGPGEFKEITVIFYGHAEWIKFDGRDC